MHHQPRAAQVDADHGVEVLDAHVEDHAIAQDARVVDNDVDIAKLVDGGLKQVLRAVEVGDVIAVGDGLAAHLADKIDDFAGGAGRAAAAVELGADVVDDDLGTLSGEFEGVLAAEAAARARDNDNAA